MKRVSILGALLGMAVMAAPASALTLTGKVIKVADGDSLTILYDGIRERVRLVGIDAPDRRQEVWGDRATEYLTQLVMGKTVRVETDPEARDKYGKILGYVFVGKSFVNLEMLKQGYAMLYGSPQHMRFHQEFVQAVSGARAAGRNIWAKHGGLEVTPYEFRHGVKPPASKLQDGLPNEAR